MLSTTRAIVIGTTKYGDSKLFVSMYTREHGMLTFVCSLGARSRRRGMLNHFQPLSIVEVDFDLKPTTDIHKLNDVRIDYPAQSIPFDAYKLSISLFLAEFLRHALAHEQGNEALFDYVAQSIEWLDVAQKGFSNFHIIFMMHLAKFLGFSPDTDEYYPGAWFDLREGSFMPMAPAHNDSVRPADASLVSTLDRLSFQTMHLLKLSRNDRNEMTEAILNYYRLHIPSFPELRSLAVLKELFQ